jgi:protein involved in polysaccharide export with SLBB domain
MKTVHILLTIIALAALPLTSSARLWPRSAPAEPKAEKHIASAETGAERDNPIAPEAARADENESAENEAPTQPTTTPKTAPEDTTTPDSRTWTTPRLAPGMQIDLTVSVGGEMEIEQIAKRIEGDGSVTLPLIGRVRATGRTLAEFREVLRVLYDRDYLVNPSITVDFSTDADGYAAPWGYVTVLGAVKSPGKVNIPPTQDLTLSKAIQEADGTTKVAKLSSIRIARKDKDGKSTITKVNLHDVGAKGRAEDDVRLQPHDIIFVPETIL